jgi:predicted acylesterase/phospholipase RssA
MFTQHINTVVFSGAGFAAPINIGCIRYLEEINVVGDIRILAGFSSGSLIALCTYLGMSSVQQEEMYGDMCLKYEIDMNAADDIIFSKGMDDGSCITNFVHWILDAQNIPRNITFSELYLSSKSIAKWGRKKLAVLVSNITNSSLDTMFVDTEPDMEIVLAIRMSCSIPIIFTPVFYKGSMYVDGCFFDFAKINALNFGEAEDSLTLIVRIDFEYMLKTKRINTRESDDIFCYMLSLSSSLMKFVLFKNESTLDTKTEVHVQVAVNHDSMHILDLLKYVPGNTHKYIKMGYEEMRNKILACSGNKSDSS